MSASAERLWDAVQTYRLGHFAKARLDFAHVAAQGEPEAFYWLGTLMLRGQGGPADMTKAFRSFQAGAYLGDSRSMNSLGLLYRDGELGEANKPRALAWFLIGAKTGDKSAIRNARDLDLFSQPATREQAARELRRLKGQVTKTVSEFDRMQGPDRLFRVPTLRDAMEVLRREFYTR